MHGISVHSLAAQPRPPNTRDKLRSSIMLGFVSFIPLLDGPVVPTNVASPCPAETCSATTSMVTPTRLLPWGTTTRAGSKAKASLKSDALSSLLKPATTPRRQQSRRWRATRLQLQQCQRNVEAESSRLAEERGDPRPKPPKARMLAATAAPARGWCTEPVKAALLRRRELVRSDARPDASVSWPCNRSVQHRVKLRSSEVCHASSASTLCCAASCSRGRPGSTLCAWRSGPACVGRSPRRHGRRRRSLANRAAPRCDATLTGV